MENLENENLGWEPMNTQPRQEPAPAEPQAEPISAEPESGPIAAQPEPAPVEPQPGVYHNAGTGRKESPFADSPYVMNHQNTYANVPPVQQNCAKPKKKRSGKVWKGIVAAVLAVCVVAGGCGITAFCVNDYWEEKTERMTEEMNQRFSQLQEQLDKASDNFQIVSGSPVASGDAMAPSQVYSRNKNAVVAISCLVTDGYSQGTSAGSGFILTQDGYVVSNYHVVEGASEIAVITYEGEEYEAELVGYDETNDLAVLRVDATDLPYVTLGSSDSMAVGDQVVAIGNALGELDSTMTVGYVSGKDRDVTTDGSIINMLQTDAAINPGNSGGPLFNMYGEVIGITTAKYSGTTSSGASIEGIGFAIPIDDVRGLIDDLVNYGYITGAYLGVLVSNMDVAAAQYYGMPVGAYVEEVTPGYCAEKAGLQARDIILELGGYEVETYTDLTLALRKFKAGDTTTIKVFRGGRELTLTVTLDERPHETAAVPDEEVPMPSNGSYDEWYDYFFRGQGGRNGE